MHTVAPWWLWLLCCVIIACVLVVDLIFFGGRRHHHITLRQSVTWTVIWVALALLFNLFFWQYLIVTHTTSANEKALEFFASYLVEKSLSLDNIFVFILIFKYFSIPFDMQRRVLLFGVIGAVLMRLLFILGGIWLLEQFDFVFYAFGLLLIYSSYKMFIFKESEQSIADNYLLKYLKRWLPLTTDIKSEYFLVRSNHHWYFTPLFVALVLIEVSDLIFAVDSIPAVFGITNDPFIAFSSNAFAVLGLRALYFVLSGIEKKFTHIQYALAFILCFIGVKMLLHNIVTIPVVFTLSLIILSLVTAAVSSPYRVKKK